MAKNKELLKANKAKQDEFYTDFRVIEDEIVNYKHHFKGKTVFCNCDDPEYSNFWKYFEINFTHLGLKKLVATHYHHEKKTYKLELSKDENADGKIDKFDIIKTPLRTNGDFRSPECIEILKEADIVVTNPPFSLFIPYVAQLIEYEKKFIILGNKNALTYKDIFPLFKEDKVWFGPSIVSGDREFRVPDHYVLQSKSVRIDDEGNRYVKVPGVHWFTNLDVDKRHEDLIMYKTYKGNENYYPKYENYDAINVSVTKEIPLDYYGEMGVPITFMDKYNPDQFEIIGNSSELAGELVIDGKLKANPGRFYIMKDGKLKRMYDRIVIKRK